MLYEVICWPDIQYYMEIPGFRENSYLINDEKGMEDFGSSAYFVSVDWLTEIDNKIIMTEKRYQYLNSLPIEDYDRETSVNEQEAFCEYQHKYHPDEVKYYQVHNPDLILYERNLYNME